MGVCVCVCVCLCIGVCVCLCVCLCIVLCVCVCVCVCLCVIYRPQKWGAIDPNWVAAPYRKKPSSGWQQLYTVERESTDFNVILLKTDQILIIFSYLCMYIYTYTHTYTHTYIQAQRKEPFFHSFICSFMYLFIYSFIHSSVSLTAGSQTLPKPFLHTLRSIASTFGFTILSFP